MQLSRNFSLQELIKSDTAIRKGIDNNPNADQIEKEYRNKPLDPEEKIDRSILDSVIDLFSARETPEGEVIQTSQVNEIQTPPLGNTPMPIQMASNVQQKNPQTNLTRNEEALLSPTEKVIAGRT